MKKTALILSGILLTVFLAFSQAYAQSLPSIPSEPDTVRTVGENQPDKTTDGRIHSFAEGYSLEIPDGFTTGESKKDECRYSNPDDDADLDFMVFEIPPGENGSEESLKKLREIIYNDISSFIPGYRKEEEKDIQLNNMKGFLIRASAEGESSDKVTDEMSICLSENRKHVFILHLVYPAELKEKYGSYSENILKTVRKSN